MNSPRTQQPRSQSRGLLLAALAVFLVLPNGGAGQTIGDGSGMRFGLSFGGISTVGLTVEWFRDYRSLEVTAGTWSFRDLSVSLVGKQYVGGGSVKAFVGAGLWVATARPTDERTGFAVVLRAPVGVDWSIRDDHALGAVINVNRGLWVRRSNPDDDLPLNKRLVPLPEVYYRLTR